MNYYVNPNVNIAYTCDIELHYPPDSTYQEAIEILKKPCCSLHEAMAKIIVADYVEAYN